MRLISQGLGGRPFSLELVFDLKQHGDNPAKFHELCDGVAPTVAVMQTNFGQVIGGYTQVPWETTEKIDSDEKYRADPTAFLFSLTRNSIYPIKPDRVQYATSHEKDSFTIFGNTKGTDLFVGGWQKGSNIGNTYQQPEGIVPYSKESRCFLAGGNFFRNDVYQVYKVTFV
jgi:hypothetical protein